MQQAFFIQDSTWVFRKAFLWASWCIQGIRCYWQRMWPYSGWRLQKQPLSWKKEWQDPLLWLFQLLLWDRTGRWNQKVWKKQRTQTQPDHSDGPVYERGRDPPCFLPLFREFKRTDIAETIRAKDPRRFWMNEKNRHSPVNTRVAAIFSFTNCQRRDYITHSYSEARYKNPPCFL